MSDSEQARADNDDHRSMNGDDHNYGDHFDDHQDDGDGPQNNEQRGDGLDYRAKKELEDMLLRLERHYKQEQAARLAAERRLEELLAQRNSHLSEMESERIGVKQERQALETMRQQFESELQAARQEVAIAQEALEGTEERVRASERLERAQAEQEYLAAIHSLQAELYKAREELAYRTAVMAEEMERWQAQAALTARAVVEAKQEVLERRRELEGTKDKMDRLLDKLYVGREQQLMLTTAINTAHYHQHSATKYLGVGSQKPAQLPVQLPAIAGATRLDSHGHSTMPRAMPALAHHKAPQVVIEDLASTGGGHTSAHGTFARSQGALVPSSHRMPSGDGSHYGGGGMPPSGQLLHHGFAAGGPGRGGYSSLHRQQSQQLQAALGNLGHQPQPQRKNNAKPATDAHAKPPPSESGKGGILPSPQDSYSHVQPRYAAAAAKYASKEAGRSKGEPEDKGGKGGKSGRKGAQPDRFAEGKKNAAMITAMANRWM